jgi:hypothetical protein
MISPLFPPRFFARGAEVEGVEGGLYYAHQVDPWDELWCYGEHPDFAWTYVFRGQLVQTEPQTQWSGEYFGVPKGGRCDAGQFTLRTSHVFETHVVIERLGAPPDHDPAWLSGFSPDLARRVESRSPGFQGRDLINLSGLWQGDDGGSYYVNEIPGTGRVVWYGENPAARPDEEEDETGGSAWANMFIGQRSGSTITGRWADVPRGAIDNFGEMDIEIINGARFEIVRVTGGFGGRTFDRVGGADGLADVRCSITWNTVRVLERTERRGGGIGGRGGDEVSLHIAVAKIDGATANLSDLTHSSSEVRAIDTGELASNVSGPESPVGLESVAPYTSELLPVPGASPDRAETVLGIAVAGIERDRARVTNAEDWGRLLKSTLDLRLQGGEPLEFVAAAGRRHLTARPLRSSDDYMGYDGVTFSWHELIEIAATGPRNLVFKIRGEGGEWEVSATLRVDRDNQACSAPRRQ